MSESWRPRPRPSACAGRVSKSLSGTFLGRPGGSVPVTPGGWRLVRLTRLGEHSQLQPAAGGSLAQLSAGQVGLSSHHAGSCEPRGSRTPFAGITASHTSAPRPGNSLGQEYDSLRLEASSVTQRHDADLD
ncbi:hypothetical protein GN956_G20007 [Arapaima gigas]